MGTQVAITTYEDPACTVWEATVSDVLGAITARCHLRFTFSFLCTRLYASSVLGDVFDADVIVLCLVVFLTMFSEKMRRKTEVYCPCRLRSMRDGSA